MRTRDIDRIITFTSLRKCTLFVRVRRGAVVVTRKNDLNDYVVCAGEHLSIGIRGVTAIRSISGSAEIEFARLYRKEQPDANETRSAKYDGAGASGVGNEAVVPFTTVVGVVRGTRAETGRSAS